MTIGYSHYFQHTKVTQEVWDKIVTDCKKLMAEVDVQITGWGGTMEDPPELNKNRIAFNGVEDNSHESFVLDREVQEDFSFCKTARKPYDLMVCACLLIYKFHSPKTIKISSDGDREDWQLACDLVTRVFGPSYMVKLELEGGFIDG